MVYVILGVLGFAIIHCSDPVSLKRLQFLKPILWAIGVGLLIYVAVMASLSPNKFGLPEWATWIGWVIFALSSVSLVIALFINLPFRKTYIIPGVGDRLVTNGMYAIVRHPGVPCTIVLIISLVLISRSYLVLFAAPCFILLDISLVIIQDRFFFDRMFVGYADYRLQTPMLIPSRKSITTFINSFRQLKTEPMTKGGDPHV
jgi:protein-S-isoprenylcysteine O-methyltransferase Ste14